MPEFFRGVGAARFGAMAGVAAALTAFFLYVAGVISEPAKSVLYGGLEPREAAQVTAKLDAMNVKYDTRGDGTILVPADQVTKLRMELASDNLPSAGVGYEIFDKSDTFGATAFTQNINRLRALEGELSRSITTISGIQSARVHLVIPDHEIFARDSQPPSASVVLKTRGRLDRGQVEAIQHLVAAAVAGMDSQRVAIVDDHGDLLAGGDGKSGPDASAQDQERDTTNFEDRLRQRVEGILSSVVGPGHVRVQVAADMNYNHVSETSESFDPDSKVVRSSQTVEQSSSDTQSDGAANAVSVANALPNAQTPPSTPGGGDKSSSTRSEETTNYEISKTVKTSTLDGGEIKKLSVAVVVDGDAATDASGKTTYKARTPKEMTQIEALVKSAIGFDAKRGDQVQVTNMEFARLDTGPAEPEAAPMLGFETGDWIKIIEVAILSITALLLGLFVMRPLITRMFSPAGMLAITGQPTPAMIAAGGGEAQAAQAAGGAPALPAPKENMIDVSRIEGQVRESSIRKVGEVVQSHPEEALAILRTWLHEPA
ncbi:MAG TPA: flagellar basal-body MS-ring/collar protein FliF [Rhizomicrobium sp.]|nr:flagellar basal-body MS-ring/collar protein FliF [Rhizomicrobium sp.]